jgi:hypothetical protein
VETSPGNIARTKIQWQTVALPTNEQNIKETLFMFLFSQI